jgi:putative transposase
MRRVIPISEQFQHFVADLQGSFWGDCYGQARRLIHETIERESLRLREIYLRCQPYERTADRCDQRNGFYFREFQTRFGNLRLKIARSRTRSFLPGVIQLFQRRAADVTLLVREAFLRGISTRQVGRVLSCLQLGPLSAQTVSRLSRSLDSLVAAFHQAPLRDEWAYLFLDGVSLRVRRPAGRKRVQMLVAYGVRRDGSRQLLAFLRSQGESQAAWQGLLEDLYRRGLRGEQLQLIITDGCPGLAAAIQTVYPRVLHQRCWVHKMRNLFEHVRRRDGLAVKHGAQAIYLADSRAAAVHAFRALQAQWQAAYPALLRKLEQDLPELLSFFQLPKHLWRKLRTTNVIERCFVEVRRRTRPMVCFVNERSVERIIYAIFHRFNEQWKNRTLRLFTQAA